MGRACGSRVRVCQGLDGNADLLVFLAVDLAQIDVLHGVVRLAQGEVAARAGNRGFSIAVRKTSFLPMSPPAA